MTQPTLPIFAKPVHQRAWLWVMPALLLLVLCAALPVMTVINYSLQDVFAGDQFIWVGTQWYQQTLASSEFHNSLLRSLLYSAIVLAIEIPLGIWIAIKMPPRGGLASLYIVLMAIPLLTPWIVVGFIWKVLVDPQAGLLGVIVGSTGVTYNINNPAVAWITIILMDVWHWTSLVVLLCYAGLQAIPHEYYQAAAIDGASRWATFRYVQLPKLKRVLLIAALLRFMDSFMVYIEPYVVTRGGPGVSTTFLSLDLVQTASIQFDLGEAGAISVIYLLIIISVCWALFSVMRGRE